MSWSILRTFTNVSDPDRKFHHDVPDVELGKYPPRCPLGRSFLKSEGFVPALKHVKFGIIKPLSMIPPHERIGTQAFVFKARVTWTTDEEQNVDKVVVLKVVRCSCIV